MMGLDQEMALWEKLARQRARQDMEELGTPSRGKTIKSPPPFRELPPHKGLASLRAYVDEILACVEQQEYFNRAWDAEKMLVNQIKSQLRGSLLTKMVLDNSVADFVGCYRGLWSGGRKILCPSTMTEINRVFQDTQPQYGSLSGIITSLTGLRMVGQLVHEKPNPFLIQDHEGVNAVDGRLKFFLTRVEAMNNPVIGHLVKEDSCAIDLVNLWRSCVEHLYGEYGPKNPAQREMKLANLDHIGSVLSGMYRQEMEAAAAGLSEHVRSRLREEIKPGATLSLINATSLKLRANVSLDGATASRPKL